MCQKIDIIQCVNETNENTEIYWDFFNFSYKILTYDLSGVNYAFFKRHFACQMSQLKFRRKGRNRSISN